MLVELTELQVKTLKEQGEIVSICNGNTYMRLPMGPWYKFIDDPLTQGQWTVEVFDFKELPKDLKDFIR